MDNSSTAAFMQTTCISFWITTQTKRVCWWGKSTQLVVWWAITYSLCRWMSKTPLTGQSMSIKTSAAFIATASKNTISFSACVAFPDCSKSCKSVNWITCWVSAISSWAICAICHLRLTSRWVLCRCFDLCMQWACSLSLHLLHELTTPWCLHTHARLLV